ncbi:MAG: histidine phosphatase family protein [Thermoplasmata archaeon]|nr:histidine phosphatase family protein [Thermoplasmata archaeon]
MIALYLLRHAHAGDPARWESDDADRPLSEKGRRQAKDLGGLLALIDEAPDLFITSPKVRSVQTAEIVAKALRDRVKVVVDERLAGALDPALVTDILLAAGPALRPCLVGHDPDFSELLGELVGTSPISMRKGTLARVDFAGSEVAPGRGILRYLVPPEVVPSK